MKEKNYKSLFRNLQFIGALLIVLSCSLAFMINDEEYLPFADQMPEAAGGLESIYSKIEYPAFAKRARIQGNVYVMVYVNENGTVDEAKVLKDIGGGCGEAAVNAIKHVKFKPGKNKGVPVKVKLTLPVNFQLH